MPLSFEKISRILQYCLSLLLFLLPCQTIWIQKEQFLNGSKWEYGTLGLYATEALLFFCAGLFCIQVWREIKAKKSTGTFHFSWTPDRRFILACAAFIAYVFCSTLWAIDRAVAWQHALWVMEAFLLFFILTTQRASGLQLSAYGFVSGAVLQSGLAMWQFLTQTTFSSTLLGLSLHEAAQAGTSIISTVLDGRWLRAYGAFPHPNMLGGYLFISLIILDLVFFSLKDRGPISSQDKIFNFQFSISKQFSISNIKTCSLFLVPCSLVILTALFFTFSRSAWLAAAIWIIANTIRNWKLEIRNFLYRLALIAILTIVFSPLVFTRFTSPTINESRSYTERVSGYQEAFSLIKQHPLLGVGIGNYTAASHQKNSNLPGYTYQPVHNVPLLFLAELGIVGVLLLLGVVILACIMYHASCINNQKYSYKLLATSYLALALFDHYLLSSHTGLLLTAIFFAYLLKNPSSTSPQTIHTIP